MLADRRTKIVATIGPASRSRENLRRAISAGMNVARLNFSHGTHEDHLQVIKDLRELSAEMHAPLTILQDLQGPKIRVGRFETGSIELVEGERVTLTTEKVTGKAGLIPSDFPDLPKASKPGGRIMLDDGLMELRIDSVEGPRVEATVIFGGTLKDRKGMNIPGGELAVDAVETCKLSARRAADDDHPILDVDRLQRASRADRLDLPAQFLGAGGHHLDGDRAVPAARAAAPAAAGARSAGLRRAAVAGCRGRRTAALHLVDHAADER